jgi:hypothetical protein
MQTCRAAHKLPSRDAGDALAQVPPGNVGYIVRPARGARSPFELCPTGCVGTLPEFEARTAFLYNRTIPLPWRSPACSRGV